MRSRAILSLETSLGGISALAEPPAPERASSSSRAARVWMLTLCAMLAGCGALRPAWNADIALVDLQISEITVFQARTVFHLRVDNAEPEPLLLDGSVHEIAIDGRRIGRGMQSERIEIPRLSSVIIEVPVDISTLAMITPVRDAIESERFDYEIRSTLFVLRGGSRTQLELNRRGRADLADLR